MSNCAYFKSDKRFAFELANLGVAEGPLPHQKERLGSMAHFLILIMFINPWDQEASSSWENRSIIVP